MKSVIFGALPVYDDKGRPGAATTFAAGPSLTKDKVVQAAVAQASEQGLTIGVPTDAGSVYFHTYTLDETVAVLVRAFGELEVLLSLGRVLRSMEGRA